MVQLILFALSSVGFTYILVDSDISINTFKKLMSKIYSKFINFFSEDTKKKLEWIPDGLDCHMCMGFWAGLFTGYCLVTDVPSEILCCGFASSFLNVLAVNFISYLNSKTEFLITDELPEKA